MEFKKFYDNLTQENWMKVIDKATEAQMELLRKAKEIIENVEDKENRMTDILETEETVDNILEGDYEQVQQNTRIFTTLSALTQYITAFKIENGQYAKGILRDSGRTVFQLTYLNEQL